MALVYLGLGDRTRTLYNLERALAADSQMMPWIGRDPLFDPIRSEPRFVALTTICGLPSCSMTSGVDQEVFSSRDTFHSSRPVRLSKA